LNSQEKTSSQLVIATRESRLALWQANHVKTLLEGQGYPVALLGMTTKGDQILDRSLSKVGGKGLFVKELELALLSKQAHLAVHSLKDVPMDLPEGFALSCILEREDPRDAFVSNQYKSVQDLPLGAVVGTSSLRRVVLLRSIRPDLKIVPLRGNLDTRLKKLDDGMFDGIILATAGLKRLHLESRIAKIFEPEEMLPAAGQGAIGIEILSSNTGLHETLRVFEHSPTSLAITAERAVSKALGGSCSMPLAAFAQWQANQLVIRALWGDPEEAQLEFVEHPSALLAASAQAIVTTPAQALELGLQVAQQLIDQGAKLGKSYKDLE
jgi:hydroxymethylbilane synthase